ncbi:MAG: BNR-4 repeat-containing protein [Tabrizicola sp.]|nr:BNR-4 repeat-containing protein [Tabrizicola sp.]
MNCKPYAVEPIVRLGSSCGEEGLLGAFFTSDGLICAYTVGTDLTAAKRACFETVRPPFDAHDTPVVQSDNAGRIMVMASAHRSRPIWLMSEPRAGIQGLVDATDKLPDEMDDATYPSLLRLSDSGSLRLIYRFGGPARSQWRLSNWDSDTGTWGPARSLLSGISKDTWPSGPYPCPPIPLPGDRFGVAYCWRSRYVEHGTDKPMNIGIDYVDCAGDLSSVRTSGGISLSIPVSPSNSERVIAVPWGAELRNQSGACAIDGQMPCFVGSWRAPGQKMQLHFCWLEPSGNWRTVTLTAFAEESLLDGPGTLPTLVSRPVVVPAGQGRVVVLYRNSKAGGQLVAQRLRAPNFDPQDFRPLVLIDGGLDQYEPVVERLSSAASGWLHAYVQRCAQHFGGDKSKHRESAPARLCSWSLERMFR